MILRELGAATLAVTQSDHARLAADLLAVVRLPGLADHPRRAELLAAVAAHDNGWWEADAVPRVDSATGAALDFRSIAPVLRLEIAGRGVERFAAARPYDSALFAAHLLRPAAPEAQVPAGTALRAGLERRRDELLAAAARGAEELAADAEWLTLADELSLAVCTGDAACVRRPGWRVAAVCGEGLGLRLDPFPLAGATRLRLRARRIRSGPWSGDADLGRALAEARWEELPVLVAPLDS